MKLILFVLMLVPWYISCDPVVVSTQYGKIKGYTRVFDQSLGFGNVSKVNIFLGIPYAAPPVGELRFRPPVNPKPWKGIYDATKFKPMCYQDPEYNKMFWNDDFKWAQSDDCLYMNIYAPNTSRSDVFYPVMVYIHGGGYEAGSPVISPGDILPLWEVVLVTIQYRLGSFGFISTGDTHAPGNYGMLDQIEVLKWIKDNIKVFQGDPSKVTIFGESAGGSSVGLLLLSPLSKGLFHSAIPLSGIDFSPFAVNKKSQALHQTNETAKKLNCPTLPNSKGLIDCLRKVTAFDISTATVSDTNVWRPVVDGIFLHDTPRNLREKGQFHRYPLLVGITQDEGSYFVLNYTTLNVTPFLDTTALYYATLVKNFERPKRFQSSELVNEAIAFQYTPWPDSGNVDKLKKALFDLISDYSFTAPVHAVMEYHSPVAPTYMFVFSHRSNLSSAPSWKGVPHKEDTPYQFGFPLMNIDALQLYDEQDRNVSQIMITLMTNFARTHNPTPHPVRGCILKRFTPTDHSYLNITIQPTINANFHGSNVAFWNRYLPKLTKMKVCNQSTTVVLGSTSIAGTPLCSITSFIAGLLLNLLI